MKKPKNPASLNTNTPKQKRSSKVKDPVGLNEKSGRPSKNSGYAEKQPINGKKSNLG